jgi:hypothetical protein
MQTREVEQMKDASGERTRRRRHTRVAAREMRPRRARRVETSRTSWLRSAAGAVVGVLLKALLVPALVKLAGRIPLESLWRLCRALWQRIGRDPNAQS